MSMPCGRVTSVFEQMAKHETNDQESNQIWSEAKDMLKPLFVADHPRGEPDR